jgi:hypothetical protein
LTDRVGDIDLGSQCRRRELQAYRRRDVQVQLVDFSDRPTAGESDPGTVGPASHLMGQVIVRAEQVARLVVLIGHDRLDE